MAEKVAVFDTTMRDGEQAAGTRLGRREKLMLARQLANLGVDVIEAGYPASSPEDFEAVRSVAHEIQGPTVCALSRAVATDVEACARALAGCPKPRIHTGIGVSDVHILGKFRDERYGRDLAEKRARLIEMAAEAVRLARRHVDDVEFYAEDAGRAELSYVLEMVRAAVEAGATVVNIPDTTGYAVPEQYGALIRSVREAAGRAVVSVHCHDDLGMAVANTLAGVLNGARQVEGTINGVGERAGNAALEEVVMALRTRADYFGVETGVETRELHKTSRLVAELLGVQPPPNKAVVGANAFSHSSGIHVDGVLKRRETYEIMRPEDVGMTESRVVLTARTGRHGLRDRLARLGCALSDEELDRAYQKFLLVADRKREVFDEDLVAIVQDEIHVKGGYLLEYLHIYSGTAAIPTATVRLRDGEEAAREGAAVGDGPVDAVYRAIAQLTGAQARVERYEIRAITSGAEALGEATVVLEQDGRRVTGRGASTDVIEASAKAYIDALNLLNRTAKLQASA
jgi:2-isopropylmalate synthase